MDKKHDSTPGEFLLIGVFLIFLTLKLCGVIDWSWWWVTSPFWIPFAFCIVLVIGVAIWWGATHDK
jgi:branched-subunit amino acid ABC-type transport system permease component